MAINPETQYPGKIAPSTPDYPYGAARNITLPGDGTGTPWEAALVNDLFGFQQALLSEAAVVPSGSPDKVGASQYLAAIYKLQGYINVKSFGAKGDGVTDDSAAIQAALDSLDNRGATLYFPAGVYNYGTLSISNPVRITGDTRRTVLRTNDASLNKISISTPHQVIIENIELSSSVTQTGGAYMYISSSPQNVGTVVRNVIFNAPFIGLQSLTGSALQVHGNYFVSYINAGINMRNDVENDSGDHYFSGNVFDAGPEASAAIVQTNSGGLKIIGNKFLNGTYHYLGSFNQTGAGAMNTSILLFEGNSTEQASVANVAFNGTSPTSFKYINIVGNQFSIGSGRGIFFSNQAYTYADTFNISDNIFNLGGTAPKSIVLNSCRWGIVGPNVHLGNSTGEQGITIADNVDNVQIYDQYFHSLDANWVLSPLATNIRFISPEFENGSETSTTSNAQGALYATSVINVSFTKEHPIEPHISATVKTGGGAIGSSVDNVTKTGFDLTIYGTVNGGSASVDWSSSFK